MADEPLPADEAPYFTGVQPAGLSAGMPRARFNEPVSTIAPHGFLTPQEEFGNVERGNPLPFTLPLERRREVGLERETWQLEIVADPESDTKIEQPLSKEFGTAI